MERVSTAPAQPSGGGARIPVTRGAGTLSPLQPAPLAVRTSSSGSLPPAGTLPPLPQTSIPAPPPIADPWAALGFPPPPTDVYIPPPSPVADLPSLADYAIFGAKAAERPWCSTPMAAETDGLRLMLAGDALRSVIASSDTSPPI